MRIATRLLLIGLFACGLSFNAFVTPLAQQPGTVTVRPRVTATQPGVPEVKVTVDHPRVAVGAEVTFTLSPARVVADSHYRITLFFGDGKRQIMRQAKISHAYPQSGTYTYSVLVEPEKQSTPAPTPLLPVPNVRLSVSPTTVEANQPVNFSAQLSRRSQNLKYRFVFGDGSDTGWQDDAKATHVYRAANTFRAYVDVGVVSNGSVKQAAGSERQSIKITEPPRPLTASVKLSVSSGSIGSGDSVTYTARANPQPPNAKYRFDFGDKSVTAWQTSASATHRYKAAGKYSARVDMRAANRSNAPQTASDTASIEVKEPAAKPTIDLNIIPATVPLGLPVLLQAVPSAAPEKVVYRFNFGDGSAVTNWSSDPIQTHVYAAAKTYTAVVEMAIAGGKPVTSSKKQIRVTPLGPIHDTRGNQNSNSGSNQNSNSKPGSNANRDPNWNGNANVTGATNSNGNSNTAGSANANARGQANANTNSQTNRSANSNDNPNANNSVNINANSNGNRNANANVNSAGNANSNANVSPEPSPNSQGEGNTASPGWWDWKYLIIAAILFFAGYQAFSYFYAPRPTFVPHFDPGDSKVGPGKPLSIDLQMDVDSNIRDGEVRIDTQGTNLIKSKRTEP